MSKGLKGISELFIITILSLAIVVGIGYVSYQKSKLTPRYNQQSSNNNSFSEDTNYWYPYINTKYGFSIKYPINLFPEYSESTDHLWITFFEEKKGYNHLVKTFSVSVNENSLEEEVSLQKQIIEGRVLKKLSNEEKISLNGYPGVRLDFIPTRYEEGENSTSAVVINKGKFSYSIVSDSQNIEQIISTFIFITPSNPKPGWKTLEDKKIGIQISFPSDFTYKQVDSDLTLSNKKITLTFFPDFQGSPCANAPCNKSKKINLNIAGCIVRATQIWPNHSNNYTFISVIDYPKPSSTNYLSLSIFGIYPKEDYLELINQILSTFRFVGSSY